MVERISLQEDSTVFFDDVVKDLLMLYLVVLFVNSINGILLSCSHLIHYSYTFSLYKIMRTPNILLRISEILVRLTKNHKKVVMSSIAVLYPDTLIEQRLTNVKLISLLCYFIIITVK
jgi:hypothetical protein